MNRGGKIPLFIRCFAAVASVNDHKFHVRRVWEQVKSDENELFGLMVHREHVARVGERETHPAALTGTNGTCVETMKRDTDARRMRRDVLFQGTLLNLARRALRCCRPTQLRGKTNITTQPAGEK